MSSLPVVIQATLIQATRLGKRRLVTWLNDKNLRVGLTLTLVDEDGVWVIDALGQRMNKEDFNTQRGAHQAFSRHLEAQRR